jgi:hypothetical protein
MKTRVTKRVTRIEDLALDVAVWLPTAPRIKHGLKTKCGRCGLAIADEMFVGGFKSGSFVAFYHRACLDAETEAMLVKSIADDAAQVSR